LNELFQKRKHDDGEESPTKQVRSKKKGGDEETNPKGLKRKKGNDLGDFPSKRKKVGNSENDAKSSKKKKGDDVGESPSKQKRRVGNSESSQGKKGDDVGESPLKQKRVGNSENKAKSSKSKKGDDMGESPSKPTRVGNRLKDFPAGNASTSASRMAFLKSLCKVPKFCSLVDLVPTVVSCYLFGIIFCISFSFFSPRLPLYRATFLPGLHGEAAMSSCLRIFTPLDLSTKSSQLRRKLLGMIPFFKVVILMRHCSS